MAIIVNLPCFYQRMAIIVNLPTASIGTSENGPRFQYGANNNTAFFPNVGGRLLAFSSSFFIDKAVDDHTRIGVCQFEECCTILMFLTKEIVWRVLGTQGAAILAHDGSSLLVELSPQSIDKVGAALVDVCGAGPIDTICCVGCGTGALPTLLAQHTGCKAIGFDLCQVRSSLSAAGMLTLLDRFGNSPSFNSQVYLEQGDILDRRALPSCKILILSDKTFATNSMAHISRLISVAPPSLQYVVSFKKDGSVLEKEAGLVMRSGPIRVSVAGSGYPATFCVYERIPREDQALGAFDGALDARARDFFDGPIEHKIAHYAARQPQGPMMTRAQHRRAAV